MKTVAVGVVASVFVLPSCVSSTKYRQTEDELARTQDELSLTRSSLEETEDMLVDVDGQRQALQEKAALADQLAAEKAALEARVQQLMKEGTIKTTDGTVIFAQDGMYGYRMEGDVVFAPGSDKLTKEGERILSSLAAELKRNSHPIKVVGHTDSDPINKTKDRWTRGNIELGANRAMSVREFLISQGLPENRIWIESCGPYRPIAEGKSAEAKARNRRVEVMVAFQQPSSSNS